MAGSVTVAGIEVEIELKPIKNTHLSVYPPDGRTLITAPLTSDTQALRLFVIKNLKWIRSQQARFRAQEREPAREFIERESHMLWGRRYLLSIHEAARPAIVLSGRSLRLHVPRHYTREDRSRLFDGWYRAELRKRAQPIAEKWARQLRRETPRIFIQRMKTKWGSSSPARGSIRVNLDLAKFTPDHLDYVILHEIAHFKAPDHSPQFRAILDLNMQGWQAVRQKLNSQPLPVRPD